MNQRTIQPIWLATLLLLATVAMLFKTALAFSAFLPSQEPVGYVAQLRPTNPDLSSNAENIFRTLYERDGWSGNVLAFGIDKYGAIASTPKLNMAELLDARTSARTIVTMKSDGSKVPFSLNSLSATQQGYLSRSTAETGVASSQQVLDYLRGDRSLETDGLSGALRARISRLGDIVHSRPFYVSDSRLASGRAKTASAPLPTLFVGSNDGMLHAFDASFNSSTSGQERWAYVPSMLIPKMSALADTSYAHDYFVDGSVSVGYISAGAKRILVGALGAGGRGLYALDITGDAGLAPGDEATAASHIKWEITTSTINYVDSYSYANLGYTYSNPILGKVKDIDAVIVGNGYLGADGRAYLYIINADTGALMGSPIATDSQTGNGLSTPAVVDSDGDGSIDYVFAGDLLGRMWRFDVNSGASKLVYDTARTPAQPITMAPSVRVHPNGGYMVNFATGSMLTAADSTDGSTVYAAYGIWDSAPATNTAMLTQTLTTRCFKLVGGACSRYTRTITSPQTPDWSTGTASNPHSRGWITPLPAGERVVGSGSLIDDGRFHFIAYNPTASSTPIAGAQSVKGSNYLMELNSLSGGVAENRPFLDFNEDGQITDADRQVWRTGDVETSPATSNGSPILTADGVPVGYFYSIGVSSQPVLVQAATTTKVLFNQNPDVDMPRPVVNARTVTTTTVVPDPGISGGDFDVDFFYGPSLSNCSGRDCKFQVDYHSYDSDYDATGMNFLDPGDAKFNLSKAIPSTSTPFKVLVQNQYLSPAAQIHIGDSSYRANVDAGYTNIKNYQTSPSITAMSLLSSFAPTYTRANIGSFAVNLPTYAFFQKDWWGGVNGLPADVRTGLHPTSTACVLLGDSAGDGNMFHPAIPPSGVTATGNGTKGYSFNDANNSRASGVRHNGALTFQVIRADTPVGALEQVVAGRPEYGWTVKRDQFTYVLAEYNIYWPYYESFDICYGWRGWTKLAKMDPITCTYPYCPRYAVAGDPRLGRLTSNNLEAIAKATTTVSTVSSATAKVVRSGAITTITYSDGYVITMTQTSNTEAGTTSIRTTDSNGADTTQTYVSPKATVDSGGSQRGTRAITGRISWRELVQP
ncbi:hypothetical protein DIC66_03100 [Rhodoferax lacus]|uniref:PilY1 beta-propeller domain-containing protein n=1 Tax=Rhodoferax lacus TaxID=2184758 RepID=A0A3E1RIQ0_9BURK|nr:PilC/PilY family type IV pilus protein [Rhodoferax lacus]RFO98872.1 hypothetical protein DIC66_03100 [Rhodoferax lacus]